MHPQISQIFEGRKTGTRIQSEIDPAHPLSEARKYEVLPLDASVATRLVAPRHNITAGRTVFTYTTPLTGIPQGDSPLLMNTSYSISADVEVPAGGEELVTQKMAQAIPLIFQWDETFDIGSDTGTPVDDKDYQIPFAFTGKISKLTLKLDRAKLTPADIDQLESAQRNNKRSE